MSHYFGGIEAGGTKFVCMVARSPEAILDERRIPATHPDETLQRAIEFFLPYARLGKLAAVGIAAFGPVDLNPASATFGNITTTPKPGWSHVDLRARVERALNLPIAFDTDVNAAAFGEQYWNPDFHALDPFVYMTVGTGIGVGVIANRRPLHGLVHSEAGHMAIPHDRERDPFPGICPYHGDCLEGLACGPAMAARWGQTGETLPAGHPAWDLEAEYIALALANLIYALSPQRIILGGGVLHGPELLPKVRAQTRRLLNGYIQSPWVGEKIDAYILPPTLGKRSGVLGAIALAIDLARGGATA
ncbi:MAG: ROK family protein [Anaerolineales bacterium]|nr:ROK family protein [Anaerolineales bacterium]